MAKRPDRPGRETVAQLRPSLATMLVKLRPRDIMTIARALMWAATTRVLMTVRGWSFAARSLGLVPAPAEIEPGEFPVLSPPAGRAVNVTRKVLEPFRAKCLPRSVAVVRALAAEGVEADLVIGVVKNEGFKAHAWVEIAGYAVAEGGRNEWAALARFRRRS